MGGNGNADDSQNSPARWEDVAKILAEGASKQPWMAATALIVIVAAIVTIRMAGEYAPVALILFFALAIGAVRGLFVAGVGEQRNEIRELARQSPALTAGGAVNLTDEQRRQVQIAVATAVADVAETLHMPAGKVRGNIFAPDGTGQLRILTEFAYHISDPTEMTISMPIGYGSTGRAFQSREPNIAILKRNWGHDILADAEMRKLHPSLSWIISVPIFGGSGHPDPVWILNVDGLARVSEDELETALGELLPWGSMISLILRRQS
jgi:hypothetical protein